MNIKQPINLTNMDDLLTQVGTAQIKEDKEAFAIIQVQKEEVRDLDFVSDASQALTTYCKKMTEGNISPMERR